ncbi:hypothetical protein ASAP_0581 [Asaia bogorensis]|uniref:Uncharacterized protein n=1 Tax=Asaia bogorensis TaxID=91915 RepID=A0A060QHB7_9PROT|nr:hypothetical protein ASAP_0581 [Asaia bogorensis]
MNPKSPNVTDCPACRAHDIHAAIIIAARDTPTSGLSALPVEPETHTSSGIMP